MSSNKPFAAADAYPAAFLAAIQNGSGVIYAKDLPWSTIVSAKRFRQCITLVRRDKLHPLSEVAAGSRWSVRPTPLALIISGRAIGAANPPMPSAVLIEQALK